MEVTYKDHIKSQACFVYMYAYSGYECLGPIDPHHVRCGFLGMAMKPPDDRNLIPLCRKHHQEIHKVGVKTFARKYRIKSYERLVKTYWDKYLLEICAKKIVD